MKIAIVNTYDIQGGAARAAYRLHSALNAEFADSSMLVVNKTSGDKAVSAVKNETDHQTIDHSYVLHNYVPRYSVYENRTDLSNTLFSIPYPAYDISSDPLIQSTDLINLHWVAFFQSPVTISNLLRTGKPVVWTLHDMNPFTGGCHYSAGCDGYTRSCQDCPQLSNDPYSFPNAILKDKLELFDGFPLTIVTPSKWLADCARKSSLFRNCRIEVIPNCIEIDIFTPISKSKAKAGFGINRQNIVLMFGADSSNEKRKGFAELEAALVIARGNPLFDGMVRSGKITVLSLGPINADMSKLGLDVKPLGHINDDILISQAYSAADIFILPSLEDNLPNMMLEAMACGTPVLAFGVGGIPDVVKDGVNGCLVPTGDVNTLAERLIELVTNKSFRERLGAESANHVHKVHTPKIQADRYLALFEDLLNSTVYRSAVVTKNSVISSGAERLAIESGPNFESIRHKVMLDSLLKAIPEICQESAPVVQYHKEIVHGLESQLESLKKSLSWRITKPLRWLGNKIRR